MRRHFLRLQKWLLLIVITLVINYIWSLFQLDVNNVFLYSELDDHGLPFGYHSKGDNQVCKLLNFLYLLEKKKANASF